MNNFPQFFQLGKNSRNLEIVIIGASPSFSSASQKSLRTDISNQCSALRYLLPPLLLLSPSGELQLAAPAASLYSVWFSRHKNNPDCFQVFARAGIVNFSVSCPLSFFSSFFPSILFRPNEIRRTGPSFRNPDCFPRVGHARFNRCLALRHHLVKLGRVELRASLFRLANKWGLRADLSG